MAEATAEQSRVARARLTLALMFVVTQLLFLGSAVWALSEPVGNDPAHPAIKRSALPVPLLWWAGISLVFMTRNQYRERFTRVLCQSGWASGSVYCLLHIAVAFHLGHGWSHEAAWEHTKQAGGYGDGIYANYLFALVWFADAAWACVALDSYCQRPRWLNWAIHGFLAFIVFNAAVVFGSWSSRKWFILLLLFMLAGFVFDRRSERRLQSEGERGA